MTRWSILLPWLLAVAVAAADAADQQHHRLEFIEREADYLVDASDADELRRQMDQHKPMSSGGAWHGLTSAVFDTSFELAEDDRGCALARLHVMVEITVWLPQWRPRRQPSNDLVSRWTSMLAGLRRHERGHREHVRAYAQQLYARLSGLAPTSSCAELERRVRSEIQRHSVRLRLKGELYDRFTRNGERQGATL